MKIYEIYCKTTFVLSLFPPALVSPPLFPSPDSTCLIPTRPTPDSSDPDLSLEATASRTSRSGGRAGGRGHYFLVQFYIFDLNCKNFSWGSTGS